MSQRRRLLPQIFLLCLFAWHVPQVSFAQGTSSQDAETRRIQRIAAQTQARAQRVLDKSGIPGLALAIVHGDQIVLAEGFGVTERGKNETVTGQTAFRIASLSKGFAGTLSGILVEQGALRWDTPVQQQLPGFEVGNSPESSRLTVQDVLSHQLGLGMHALDRELEADQSFPELSQMIASAPLRCQPGECYSYQNVAFSLIGDICFAVTGSFYTELVQKRLFTPLQMHNASFGRENLESSKSWARPHVRAGRSWRAVRPKENYYRVPPAAGINASVEDLGKRMIAQLGHRQETVSKSVLSQIQTPRVRTNDQLRGALWRRDRLIDAHYGLGWRVYRYGNEKMVYHAGAVQGYRALTAMMPNRDVGIVLLWNSESAAPSGLMPEFMDAVLGLPARDWTGIDAP